MNEKQPSFFSYGSKWLLADFHLHTKQDKQFTDKDYQYNDYVDCLKKAGIHIGVITNHNKFNRHEYSELRTQGRKEDIWILPGVELSVKDGAHGIHALIVFDPDTWLLSDQDFINIFLTSAFEGVKNWENADARCTYDLNTLFKKLDNHRAEGRDSFIVLAHVTSDNGFFNELDGGRIQELAGSSLFWKNVLGMQKVNAPEEKIQTYQGWLGGSFPASVEGSDCKSLAEIGKCPLTYVKVGYYNFNALKLALLEKENRISKTLPEHKTMFIESMNVIGGKLNGQQFDFSSGLNCLIGIRGSGKSSILELLRYALDMNLTRTSADMVYKNGLIEYVLGSGGKVIVHCVGAHGKKYRIEKIYGQQSVLYDEESEYPLHCSLGAVFKMPLYFGQKDLSNKDDDFEVDLLHRLTGDRLSDTEKEIEGLKQNVLSDLLEMRKMDNIGELEEENKVAIKNANVQLQYYTDKGLESKMKVQADFNSDKDSIENFAKWMSGFLSDEKNLMEEYRDMFNAKVSGSETNKDLFSRVNDILQKMTQYFGQIDTILSEISSSENDMKKVLTELEAKRNTFAEDFAQIKRELHTDDINPDHFLELKRKLSIAKLKLTQLEKQQEQREVLSQKLEGDLDILNTGWLKQFHILEEEAKKVNSANNSLMIKLTFKGKRNDMLSMMKEVFRGTNIRETTYSLLVDKYSDFIEMYKDCENWKDILSPAILPAFQNRFMENISDLLTHKVEDAPTIYYKEKPLNQYSLGQRASALILFLLAQKDTDVLIIDQPEDDLDNQTIYNEVIKSILGMKGTMQFVFATHNANIPVLGDSENVFCCSFEKSDKINILSGSVDVPEIQKKIVEIMEGGKDAFQKRKEIYSIWEK